MKKFIYLISPEKINKEFYINLKKVLSYRNVKFFQLRLKAVKKKEIINISLKIKKITKKFNVKFIVNDYPEIAKAVNADGCHLGQKDGVVKKVKKKFQKKFSWSNMS